jgi:hypothetical protein
MAKRLIHKAVISGGLFLYAAAKSKSIDQTSQFVSMIQRNAHHFPNIL